MAKCPHCGEAYPDTAYYRGRLQQSGVVAHYESCDEYAKNAEIGRLVELLGRAGVRIRTDTIKQTGELAWVVSDHIGLILAAGTDLAAALRDAAAKLGIETEGDIHG